MTEFISLPEKKSVVSKCYVNGMKALSKPWPSTQKDKWYVPWKTVCSDVSYVYMFLKAVNIQKFSLFFKKNQAGSDILISLK